MSYPRIQTIIVFLVCAALVGAAALHVSAEQAENKARLAVVSADNVRAKSFSEDIGIVDSDSDGLEDWLEILIGTDPHNPDTDGDGTPDGEEVQLGRNPLVPGPDDMQPVRTATVSGANTGQSTSMSPTDRLGQQFFSKYMELSQAGLTGSVDISGDFARRIVEESSRIEIEKEIYTVADIVISNDTSRDAIKRYGNEFGTILQSHGAAENELVILRDSLEQDDPSMLARLDPIIAGYENIIGQMLGMTVPSTLAEQHIAFMNGVSTLRSVARSAKSAFTDPLTSLRASEEYLTGAEMLFESVSGINAYVTVLGITYAESEPGYMFNRKSAN